MSTMTAEEFEASRVQMTKQQAIDLLEDNIVEITVWRRKKETTDTYRATLRPDLCGPVDPMNENYPYAYDGVQTETSGLLFFWDLDVNYWHPIDFLRCVKFVIDGVEYN